MPNIQTLRQNLEARGFRTSYFETPEDACAYLNEALDQTEIGFGGSITVQELGLYEQLSRHNTCRWHWRDAAPSDVADVPVYICSVNGMAETGELVNIDGAGNRVSAGLFGRKKLYFIIGTNKIAPDLEGALWRARNIAAPKNARRLNKNTPCAAKADRCYDCNSPDCICSAIVTYRRRPSSIGEAEVVIINRELGY